MDETKTSKDLFMDLLSKYFEMISKRYNVDNIIENESEIKIITTMGGNQEEFSIQKSQIDKIYSSIDLKQIEGETILYDNFYYETLLEFNYRPFLYGREGVPIRKEDQDNGLTYEISLPSDEYLIFILEQIVKKEQRRRPRILFPRNRFDDAIETGDLLKLFRAGIPTLFTLKITSENSRKLPSYFNLKNSFLFNLSYNLDQSIVEVRLIDEFMRWNRLSPIRRRKIEDIDPPRRKYISNLVYQYQLAVSNDSPLLQFISFYHVVEHFFDEIYSQDLIDTVTNMITDPGFSSKKNQDEKKLIKFIEDKKRQRGDDFSYNEKVALQLTLEKYIKPEEIKTKIEEYDVTLIDYYKNNPVSFSNGPRVDFTSDALDQTFKNLTSRIYNTRNATVHSKEGDKPRYIPFEHDKELFKEIPLIRMIAEDIIINSSELIKI